MHVFANVFTSTNVPYSYQLHFQELCPPMILTARPPFLVTLSCDDDHHRVNNKKVEDAEMTFAGLLVSALSGGDCTSRFCMYEFGVCL